MITKDDLWRIRCICAIDDDFPAMVEAIEAFIMFVDNNANGWRQFPTVEAAIETFREVVGT